MYPILSENQRLTLAKIARLEHDRHSVSIIAGNEVSVTKYGCDIFSLHRGTVRVLWRLGLVVLEQFHEDTPNYTLARLTDDGHRFLATLQTQDLVTLPKPQPTLAVSPIAGKENDPSNKLAGSRVSQVSILCDCTSVDDPNILTLTRTTDGDIIFGLGSSAVQIAMSGTRYSREFRKAAIDFFEATKREMMSTQHPALQQFNEALYSD